MRKEPFEELMCEVEEDHTGAVIEAVTLRKGEVRRQGEPLSHLLKLRSRDQTCRQGTLFMRTRQHWGYCPIHRRQASQ